MCMCSRNLTGINNHRRGGTQDVQEALFRNRLNRLTACMAAECFGPNADRRQNAQGRRNGDTRGPRQEHDRGCLSRRGRLSVLLRGRHPLKSGRGRLEDGSDHGNLFLRLDILRRGRREGNQRSQKRSPVQREHQDLRRRQGRQDSDSLWADQGGGVL